MAENKHGRRKSAAKKKKTVSANENVSPQSPRASEINERRWSVVSFEKLTAKNLTYAAAVEKLNQLHANKVSGLCIVTDEAAQRITNVKRMKRRKN